MILLAASLLTFVAAANGAAQVSRDELLRRLQALAWASVVDGDTVHVQLPTSDAARMHHLRLRVETGTGLVHVQETLSATAARPHDASEADMRGMGSPAFDPTRPEANSIFQRMRQTTMIDSQRLSQTPWPADAAAWASYDAEGLVTLACAVVIRSGWGWQPALFGR
jgi:hypothetical protein